ncbi:30S ribosomal protein S8 [Leptospira biflexa]|jgi:small subunit ribosomal protein S8|uniref:Small ribosomal subunit protein uS8 n=23 Tax=Leptospira TaxID=171 RepID=RS8_LEPBP|nr:MULTISPECIES: 30S ribosomal protein S8 [Leptospira]B0SA33.1 RecName: Full=Small ribosomal subunit protein uS8; AltName: Full=30S ribosomal protein S8 [Leptospira biflexa serovar Patoc strain 'Patoc 1 (Ames)']B0SSG4.1 RecName: Full=Small ribosomal subunit protein uS8; AltName: Full=30S ribosomal protein S8 [Leptospira biflexa serovar Patoc strain 'Patoc 1 (Paris)']PKA22009.1 30S ribosomal protein S8 [Leptospira sp. mixed culture ATI2-C-A1]ABZ94403.1 30S Ribosomal protein S8 [Leptospira biflex
MSLSDPIADMLTRIRNAQQAKHELCVIPGSKIKKSILDLLKEEGFVDDVQTVKNGSFDDFQVKLKYDTEKKPVIRMIERVSTPGRRVYIQSGEIRPFRNNIGTLILSTSKGVMTGKRARKLRVGGEVLCKVF